jgi:type IX secretion system PorP/SprF family membrane protein
MKKIFYILIFVGGLFNMALAQQLPQYTNYVLNDFVLNPALSGVGDDFEVKSNNRYQWIGINGAPRTYVLSAEGPQMNKNMGYGGYVYSDVTGPTSRVGFDLSYAYHVKLTEKMKLSLGLSGGLQQFSVDGTQITLHDQNDPALGPSLQSVLVPDVGFGALLYTDKYYLGISIPQIYQAQLKFFDYTSGTISTLASHYFVSGGYKYDATDNLRLEPSFMLNYVSPVPVQVNVGVRAIYKKMTWLGLSYRSGDAVSVLIGYTYQDYLMIAYAYDIPISTISKYGINSQEIMFGLKFKNKAKK